MKKTLKNKSEEIILNNSINGDEPLPHPEGTASIIP